jgi:hypothetical protein
MSKFLLNVLLQISKALLNSKNLIFNSEIIFPCFRPGQLCGPFPQAKTVPAGPPAAPSPQAKTVPAGTSSPCVGRVFVGNTFSLSDHAFPSRPPHPPLSVNRAPPLRFTPSPMPTDPDWKSPAPRMPPSFYNPPSSLSSLNPLQTEP